MSANFRIDIHSQYLAFPLPPLITNPQASAQLSLAALKRNLEAHAFEVRSTRPEIVQRLSEILKIRKLDMLVKDMLSGNDSGLRNLWLDLNLTELLSCRPEPYASAFVFQIHHVSNFVIHERIVTFSSFRCRLGSIPRAGALRSILLTVHQLLIAAIFVKFFHQYKKQTNPACSR